MRRYILTGAPGAGKTVLLRRLELAGYGVVEEAATDLIALVSAQGVEKHWEAPSFIEDIVDLQVSRQRRADSWPDESSSSTARPSAPWRSASSLTPSPRLGEALDRIQREGTYERRVFLLDLLGFITPTDARRITLEDSRRFEAVHADAYRRLGYDCIRIAPADVETRFRTVMDWLGSA